MSEDSLGDRLKNYESLSTGRKAFKGQPFVIRLDGKNFSNFTRGLRRPYDERLSQLMVQVTADLVQEFGALVGYTQSDEISLGFYVSSDSKSDYLLSQLGEYDAPQRCTRPKHEGSPAVQAVLQVPRLD